MGSKEEQKLSRIRDQVIETALDCIIMMDHEGRVLEFNAAAQRTFGYTKEEAVGAKLASLIVPHAQREAHREGLRLYLKTGEQGIIGKRIELDALHKDGTLFPVELGVTVVGAHDDEPVFAAYLRDITERRTALEAMRESEARLRQVTEYIHGVLWLADVETGQMIYVSPAYERIWNLPCETLYAKGDAWIDHVHGEDHHRIAELYREHATTGLFDAEFRLPLEGGDVRWVHCRLYPIQDAEGGVQRIAGHAEDITDRKRVESDLHMTRIMVESAADAIFWIDREARFTYVNDAACRSLGLSRGKLVGMKVFEIDETMAEEIWPVHWRELEKAGAMKLESMHRRKNGEVFPVEVSLNLVYFAGVAYNCAVVRDVTERKQAAEEVGAALQRAESANRAKDEFLANVSHEIRTPLAAILGYSDLIGDRVVDDRVGSEWVEVVRTNGEHLDRMLADILDISRIESGEIELRTGACDLRRLCGFVLRTFGPEAAKRGLELRIESSGDVPQSFVSDEARLRQVLMNVVGNAIKYTLEGSISVSVSARRDETGALLNMVVKDTGIGIPADRVADVMDRFVRASQGAVEGVGLGLFICRRVIDLLGGQITLRSEERVGTEVRFSIPVTTPGEWEVLSLEPLAMPVRSVENPGQRMGGRVLVIDDSVDLASLCRSWLEGWGLECELAHDGDSGLERAMAGGFDLVLMDWRLPVMDGLSVIREMRRRGNSVPVIALTAHAGIEARRECIAAGANEYLTKPVDPELLQQMTQRLVGIGKPSSTSSARDRLRRKYLLQLGEEIAEMRAAWDSGNVKILSQLAHRVKGTSGSFGLQDVSSLATEIENVLDRGGDPSEVIEALIQRHDAS